MSLGLSRKRQSKEPSALLPLLSGRCARSQVVGFPIGVQLTVVAVVEKY